MNLEGTKHEKAVLVVISFIIGFTCAFIAFGLNEHHYFDYRFKQHDDDMRFDTVAPSRLMPDGSVYTPPTGNPPSNKPAPTDTPADDASSSEPVSYVDGKLFAQVGEDRYVLSIQSSEMPNKDVKGFSTQGIHEALPAYKASPDGAYVYFCEQQTKSPECTNLVFDTKSRVIQFVTVDGKKLITPDTDAVAAAWDGNSLTIGTYKSATVDTPWKLTLAQ